MSKKETMISGKVYVLADNIDTDQIIPAKHLNLVPTIHSELKKLGALALSGLPDSFRPFVKKGRTTSEFPIIVAGANFGCGSSREHAPIALAAAGVKAVVAESYARIFFRNSVATGGIYPMESHQKIRGKFKTGDIAELDMKAGRITNIKSVRSFQLKPVGAVADVIDAGGIFGYARKKGMIKRSAKKRKT